MSYMRFSEGDVYVFHSIGGYIDCCGCQLFASATPTTSPTRSGMIEHMREHVVAGHDGAADVIEMLRAEIESVGDAVVDGVIGEHS